LRRSGPTDTSWDVSSFLRHVVPLEPPTRWGRVLFTVQLENVERAPCLYTVVRGTTDSRYRQPPHFGWSDFSNQTPLIESCDATFFKHIFPLKDFHSNSRYSYEITRVHNTTVKNFEQPHEIILEKDDNDAPRKSKRQMVEKFFGDISLCTMWTALLLSLQKHLHLICI
jgi:hypothetical protein